MTYGSLLQSWKLKQKSTKASAREKHDHVHVLHLCWQQYNTDLASLPEILRWHGHSLWLTQYNAFTWDIVVWIGKKPSMFYFCSGMDWLKKKLNDKCLIGNFKKVLLLFFENFLKKSLKWLVGVLAKCSGIGKSLVSRSRGESELLARGSRPKVSMCCIFTNTRCPKYGHRFHPIIWEVNPHWWLYITKDWPLIGGTFPLSAVDTICDRWKVTSDSR